MVWNRIKQLFSRMDRVSCLWLIGIPLLIVWVLRKKPRSFSPITAVWNVKMSTSYWDFKPLLWQGFEVRPLSHCQIKSTSGLSGVMIEALSHFYCGLGRDDQMTNSLPVVRWSTHWSTISLPFIFFLPVFLLHFYISKVFWSEVKPAPRLAKN